MRWAQGLGIGVLLYCAGSAATQEVAGVRLEEQVRLANSDTPLVLNGAGVRRKFFFKIYVGALYLPDRATEPDRVLAMPGPKRVLMHFLYSEIAEQKLRETWNKGFVANTTAAERAALGERLANFTAMFRTVRKGDVIRLDYLPGEGTQVWLNDRLQGTVPGADFNRAMLKLWLGERPGDRALKEGMLGLSASW